MSKKNCIAEAERQLCNQKHYAKLDTPVYPQTDFIDKVTGIEITCDALLFSVDVESLYTNIDNNSGIEAVKQAFLRNPDFDRPDVDILELLKISSVHDDFLFASNWYLQIFGTAMGKRFAPNYANLFMAEWEKQALRKCNKLPLIYLRYFWYLWWWKSGLPGHSKQPSKLC